MRLARAPRFTSACWIISCMVGVSLVHNTAVAVDCIDYAKPFFNPKGWFEAPASMIEPVAEGRHLVCAHEGAGLEVFDISDRDHPVWVSSFNLPLAHGLTMSGDLVFVANGSDGLAIVNIANPATPVLAGSLDTPGSARDLATDGHFVYVADWLGGLQVIDVSDPANPVSVGTIPGGGAGHEWKGIALRGTYAFVAGGETGVIAVDVSTPSKPSVAGTLPLPAAAGLIAVSGPRAYVSCDTSLAIIDVTEPQVMRMDAMLSSTYYDIISVTCMGSQVMYCTANGPMLPGLMWTVDATDPEAPRVSGSFDVAGAPTGIGIQGDRGYAADWLDGIRVLDVTNPSPAPTIWPAPRAPSVWDGSAIAIRIQDGREYELYQPGWAYDSPPGNGVYPVTFGIRDLTDPVRPAGSGACFLEYDEHNPADFAVRGDYAFIPNDVEFLVVSVVIPDSPEIVGSANLPAPAHSVVIRDSFAFIACSSAGIAALDIGDPVHPILLTILDTPGEAWSLRLEGSRLFVADGTRGLAIVDVADPLHLTLIGSIDTPGMARGLEVSGSQVWIADGENGVVGADCSNPMTPYITGMLDTPGTAVRLAIDGGLAYLADSGAGIAVLDISIPSNPRRVGGAFTGGAARDVQVGNGLLYLASGADLQIRASQCTAASDVDAVSLPSSPALPRIAMSPNPASGNVRISLSVESSYPVEVSVYDLTGRRVRRLVAGASIAGARSELVWDGRNDAGVRVASGVYLVRAEWSGGTIARRLTLVH